jgi:hypothetical protein
VQCGSAMATLARAHTALPSASTTCAWPRPAVHTRPLAPPPLRPRIPARPRPIVFVRAAADARLPAPAILDEYLRRWILRELSGWAQLVILELLAEGRVQWVTDASAGVRLAGAHPRRASVGTQLIAVSCEDRRGPRRPGLWAALSVAQALAERLDGVVVDPRRGVELAGPSRLRAPACARVQGIDHLCLPSAREDDGRLRLASLGMAQFGLPELELGRVPEPLATIAARLLLGVAQHLIDAAWIAPEPTTTTTTTTTSHARAREALLTVGELHWALGGEPHSIPITHGRGWTRVAVELDAGRGRPAALRIGPPLGARRWPHVGAWLRDAWADLVGPPTKQPCRANARIEH